MRSILAATIALLFSLGLGVAKAADLAQLAEGSGFLLGNAYRCGIPAARVERAGRVIRDLIADTAYDPNEEAAADARFAQIFLASVFPYQAPDALIPPCSAVVTQFDRLERHHRQAGMN